MIVEQDPVGGEWLVRDDSKILAGPFKTNAAAWAWHDAHSAPDQAMAETKRRINTAFADK